jgi:dTDP-4-dehydrorhamnose 3,5-epimerase
LSEIEGTEKSAVGIKFTETELKGAFVIQPERFDDERGFFSRNFSDRELEAHGINPRFVEHNISFNRTRHTIRGMHFQRAPHAQGKLVRCTAGAIYDVIVDLRSGSATYARGIGIELTAENRTALYVPEGFAHGFQTLANDTEVFYQVSDYYEPPSCDGVRWNDPALGIRWRESQNMILNERDRTYPDFHPSQST